MDKRHRLLVTGASGTLGHHVLAQLPKMDGLEVLAIVRAASKIREAPSFVRFQTVDFDNTQALNAIVHDFKPTCLIHCAATTTTFNQSHWFDLIRFNINTTLQLCECVSRVPGCHFVYVSTGLAYKELGRPLRETDALETHHPYGASKAAADLLIRAAAAEFKVDVTIVRPFSFTGVADDGERLFPAMLRAAQEGRALDLAPGDQVRDYCAAQDIAVGIIAAAVRPRDKDELGIFNLGSGIDQTLRVLIEKVVADLELKVDLRFGARPYMRFEPKHLVADITAARQQLSWQPKTNLSYAVWQLAEKHFPGLKLRQPEQFR